MESPNAGRWIVAALLAGCAVLGTMLALRDGDGPPPRTTSSNKDNRRADGASELLRVAPVRRHAQSASAGPLDKGGFSIVRVTESETGAPIRGATVDVPGMDDDPRVHGVTGADGVARIGPLQACEWPFLAAAKGRLGRWGEVVVEEGGESPLEIALDPSVSLEVRVEDGAGEGVESANVDVEPLGGGRHLYGHTDAHSRTALALPSDTIVRVTVKADGYSEGEAVVRSPVRGAAALPVSVVLTRPGRLVGVVRDADAKPVQHAAVIVRPEHEVINPWLDPNRALAMNPTGLFGWTDEQGRFVASGLVIGRRYHAFAVQQERVEDPGLKSAIAEGLVATPEAPDVERDFKALPPGRLVVRVTNADGSPATGATLSSDTGSWGDRNDASALLMFSADECTVHAETSDGGSARRRVAVPGGQSVEITMKLDPPAELSGVVVDDAGHPVEFASVGIRRTATPAESDEPTDGTHSEADGSWHLAAPFSDACTVTATADGYVKPAPLHAVAPAAGLRLVLRRMASVTYRLVRTGEAKQPRVVHVRIGRTDAHIRGRDQSGAFWLDYDPADGDRIAIVFGPKQWRLPVKPTPDDLLTSFAEYAPIVRTLHPVAGEVEDLGDLPLDPPSMFRARVRDAADQPVPDARMRLDATWTSMDCYDGGPPTTDSAGTVAFPCAPAAGIVPLVVTAAGFLDRHVEVSSGGSEPPTITLLRGGLAWGEVVDAAGAPVGDAEVTIADARNATTTIRADAHGVFGVRVAAGRWLLSADGGGADSAQLAEGGDTHVRLVAGGR